jgi:UDP-N-acetylglucosamine 1-carboxyvinyltransferase
MLVKKAHSGININKTLQMDVQGSKHSFSRIFPSFLQFKSGILRNVPVIKDVEIQIDIMKRLGFDLDFDQDLNTLKLSGINQKQPYKPNIGDYSTKYSRSLINLYPLFSRFNIELNEPAGCSIGRRDISWYIDIMHQFGIIVDINDSRTTVYRNDLKKVSEVHIRERSFSSTNIAIACAIEARSDTRICRPSIEPEILELVNMLKKTGVNIHYNEKNDYFHIDAGTLDKNSSVDHTILPDRNVIVTLICGVLLQKKDIIIKTYGFSEEQLKLSPFLDILKKMNVFYQFLDNAIFIKGTFIPSKNIEIEIKAGHYPLFCSDWQPLIAVLSILGVNMIIEDTLFESRFGYLNEYKKFGVKFEMINERRAKIIASKDFKLNPEKIIKAKALDLRCGAGVGLLSLLHNGSCEIKNVVQIMRGYERFDEQLNHLLGEEVFSIV